LFDSNSVFVTSENQLNLASIVISYSYMIFYFSTFDMIKLFLN